MDFKFRTQSINHRRHQILLKNSAQVDQNLTSNVFTALKFNQKVKKIMPFPRNGFKTVNGKLELIFELLRVTNSGEFKKSYLINSNVVNRVSDWPKF